MTLTGLSDFLDGKVMTTKAGDGQRIRVKLMVNKDGRKYLRVMTARGKLLSQPIVSDPVSEFVKLRRL